MPEYTIMPNWKRQRILAQPTIEAEAIYYCETHGKLMPEPVELDGVVHYMQHRCDCEMKRERQEREERERQEMLKNAHKQTYTWLGSQWSDLPLQKKTFDNFDASRQPMAYKVTKAYATKPKGTLILYGSYGSGKTHLLAALCNETLLKYGVHNLFTTSPKLFGSVQQRITLKDDYYALVNKAIRTPLLIIDDIDKAKWSEFREEIYFAIIDERVKAELPTAISTNRLHELENFVGGAVCSRLKVGQIAIEMSGSDYREEL
jgi:DNA replication protein DnaC